MAENKMLELVRKRNSCRSYDGRPLSPETVAGLERAFARCLENPFGTAVRLPVLDGGKLAGKKLGTYGVIHGASAYFVGIVKNGGKDSEGLGYAMERAVLEATAMGLGTCWLAGTYNRNDFKEAIELGPDERIVCVSPVGYPAEKRTTLDKMMRGVAGSAKRKGWDALFFDGSPAAPLTIEAAGEWRDALEAVRLAPSGSNGQPWRVIRQGRSFHFYRAVKEGSDYGRVDMGIAACHFELVAREAGLSGAWAFEEPATRQDKLVYCVTWVG